MRDETLDNWKYHVDPDKPYEDGWVTHDGDPEDKAIYVLEDIVKLLNRREEALAYANDHLAAARERVSAMRKRMDRVRRLVWEARNI